MEKRNLYIGVVIVLVVIIVLILGIMNFTGNVIGECIDSDGGNYPLTPGSVSFTESSAVYKDKCYAEGDQGIKKYVQERFCHIEMENKGYYCEAGCTENANGEGYCLEGWVSRKE